ncbi:MAG: branched-chain amino acid ABC transporter permease [Nitriliruptoraceae bacterium]
MTRRLGSIALTVVLVATATGITTMVLTSGIHGRALATSALLLAVSAVAWHLLFAGIGQLFLAVGGLSGVSGYAFVLLADDAGWPWPVSIVAAVGIATGAGMLLAWIGARRRLGAMFSGVVTLVASLAFAQVLLGARGLTGGETGRVVMARSLAGVIGSSTAVMVAAGAVVLAVAVYAALSRSATGHAARAVRDDVVAAELAGIPLVATQVRVAAVGSALIALSGALRASVEGFVNPSMFAFSHVDVRVIVAAVLGAAIGSAISRVVPVSRDVLTRIGPVAAALMLAFVDEMLRPFAQLRTAVYGVVLFALVLLLRERLVDPPMPAIARPRKMASA